MNKKNRKLLGELLTAIEFHKLKEMAGCSQYEVNFSPYTEIDEKLVKSLKDSGIEGAMRAKQTQASIEVDNWTESIADFNNISMKVRHAATD